MKLEEIPKKVPKNHGNRAGKQHAAPRLLKTVRWETATWFAGTEHWVTEDRALNMRLQGVLTF